MSASEHKVVPVNDARVYDDAALEAARMQDAHECIIKANQSFGTVVMFRAGSSFDAGLVRRVVRKSTADKDKIAPTLPAVGGIPRMEVFGKRKSESGSFGELYKYSGNSEPDCYATQVLPLCYVIQKFVEGQCVIVDTATGRTLSYERPATISETTHLEILTQCIQRIRQTNQLCIKLDKMSDEYKALSDLGYVYMYDLTKGHESAKPKTLLQSTSAAAKEFIANCLPEFTKKLTHYFPEVFAVNVAEALEGKFHPVEVYAKRVEFPDGSVELIPVGTDEDRLANAVDPDMPVSKILKELIPDIDEPVNGFDPETGEFAQSVLAGELLRLENYIGILEDKAENGAIAAEVTPLLEAFRIINYAMTEGEDALNDTMHAFIALVGCTTKREFFWQIYLNVIFHPNSAYYFFIVQHGNENRNPGIPSEIDRTLIQGFTLGRAKLELSEESFVDTLLTEHRRLKMYINPRWLHDEPVPAAHHAAHDRDHKDEKKKTITAYKAKGHIWGAVVLQKLEEDQYVELETLISFYQYLCNLNQQLTAVGAFAQMHLPSGGQLPTYQDVHKQHLILSQCGRICDAMARVSQILINVRYRIVEVFEADTLLKLNEIQGLKINRMTKMAIVLQNMQRKIKLVQVLLDRGEFANVSGMIEKTLANLTKNLLNFPGDAGVREQIAEGTTKAARYIKAIVTRITDECLSFAAAVASANSREDSDSDSQRSYSVGSASSLSESGQSASDSDSEGETVRDVMSHKVD